MAVSAKMYANAAKALANKEIDLDTDVIKVALLKDTYTPNQTTDAYFSNLNAGTNEVSSTGTNYTAGGNPLGTKTVNVSSLTFTFDAADITWPGSTITARYGVIYDDAPATAATKPLLAYVDFGANVSSNAGTFQITWDSTGIFAFVAA